MELRVHLKVCEGCGCLWFRAQVETRVYCTACFERLKEFPTPESRKRRGRPRKTTLPTVFAVQASAEVELEEERFLKAEVNEGRRGVRLMGERFALSGGSPEICVAAMASKNRPLPGAGTGALSGGAY